MPEPTKTYIVNDQPTDTDALDFTPYVETLADIIQTGNTPLTIGVFGTWGSGKTSLMKMVKKSLPDDFTVAWFDAWKYDKEETLWRAFLLSVLTSLKDTAQKAGQPTEEFEKMQSLLYREMELEKVGGVIIDLPKLGGAVATGLVKLSLSFIPGISTLTKLVEELQSGAAKSSTDEAVAAITRERTKIYIEQVQFLEQFQEKFAKLVKTHIAPKRLVVFVDDLDRCLPEKAIEVLEAIKLFLDVENCVFVLGLDQEVISRGIEMKYREFGEKQDGENQKKFTIEGVRYLEKIIQLPFQIPPVEQTDMDDFVQGLSKEWPHEECPKVFAVGLGDNPRQIKRTVNTFLMLWKLADKRKDKLQDRIKPIRLAKVVAIQFIFPELYNLIKEEPRYLGELENYYRAFDFVGFVNTGEGREEVKAERQLLPALVPFISNPAVARILTMHFRDFPDANFIGLKPDDYKLYFTLTRRTESQQSISLVDSTLLAFEPQMVKIPSGKFLIGSTKEQFIYAKKSHEQEWVMSEQPQFELELPEYMIGKYPITNREYQAFIKKTNHTPPSGWQSDQYPFEKGDHPVVNVSWNDADTYCKWLSEVTGKNYHLPTEAEWEKAARGVDGRIWPWGDEFDPSKANTKEANIGDTTSVGQFSPQGDSFFGCADTIGNVWEWCDNWFDKDAYRKHSGKVIRNLQFPKEGTQRSLRGGSYYRSNWDARCATRRANEPDLVGEAKGFRVAISPVKSEVAE